MVELSESVVKLNGSRESEIGAVRVVVVVSTASPGVFSVSEVVAGT